MSLKNVEFSATYFLSILRRTLRFFFENYNTILKTKNIFEGNKQDEANNRLNSILW